VQNHEKTERKKKEFVAHSFCKNETVMIVCDMDVNTWNYYLRKRILNDCISFSRSFNLRVICCVFSSIFPQDGAKPHTATETKDCLDEIAPDRIPNHPAKSPDLNCIEDIWSHMDREIRKQRNVPNIESLKRRLKKIWNNIPKETIRASVDSMPRRLDACIKLRGERTSY